MRTYISLFLFSFFFIFQCSYIYTPFGIRGSDALAELEESKTLAGLITLPIQQRATRLNLDSVEPPLCSLTENPIPSSTNGSSPQPFSLPDDLKIQDLETQGVGTHYFQSLPISKDTLLDTVKLQTIRTEKYPNVTDNSCRFRLTSQCNASMSISDPGYFSISSSSPTDLGESSNFQEGICLQIICIEPAVVRLRNDPKSNQDESIRTRLDAANLALGRDIFNSLAKIQKDRYYTRKSFQSCKDSIILIGLVQALINTRDIRFFQDGRIQNRFCNQFTPSLSTQKNNTIFNLLQGATCNLKEVNYIGL